MMPPHNSYFRVMKRLLFTLACGLLLLPSARATTNPFFVNSGVLVYDDFGVASPQIDASNFVNYGSFSFSTFYPSGFNGIPLPYETFNTVNYTNEGQLLGIPGFYFADFDTALPVSHVFPSQNFFNADTIGLGTPIVSGDILLFVLASNIINHGTMAIGSAGHMNLTGRNVDLSRSLLSVGAAASLTSDLWGVSDTNVLDAIFTPDFVVTSSLRVTNSFNGFQFAQNNYSFGIFNFTAYVQISPGILTDQTVDVVLIENDNPAITNFVAMGPPGPYGSIHYIKFEALTTNVVTGTITTNDLFLEDRLARTDIVRLMPSISAAANPVLAPTTFQPTNFLLSVVDNGFSSATPVDPTLFDPTIFDGTNSPFVTNTAWSVTLGIAGAVPDPNLVGSTWSNLPGRIEVNSDNLDLDRTRISGVNFLALNATNNFLGSTNAQIEAPASQINLATTNSTLVIQNLTTPAVPHMNGTIDVWSGRWTNANDTGSSLYNVTVVRANLAVSTPSFITDLHLRATNLVISDVMNVVNSLLLETERLTITSNTTSAANPIGELNLTTPELTWSASLPLLKYLTNYGSITSTNTIYFGGSRQPPWFKTTFDEPYISFVNYGSIFAEGISVFAIDLESYGTMNADLGPLTLNGTSVILENGSLSSSNSINIYANSLLVSNETMVAGRAINLSVTNFLDDGSLHKPVPSITNPNFWTVGGGLSLQRHPDFGASLLATTITDFAAQYANNVILWAGNDFGCIPGGFLNNAAIGTLVLSGADKSLFTIMSPDGTPHALYVNNLQLLGNAVITNSTGFQGIFVAPNMKVYFAKATDGSGADISAALNGANGGAFCHVIGFTNTMVFSGALPPTGGNGSGNIPASAADALTFPTGTPPTNIVSAAVTKGTYYGLFYDTNGVTATNAGYVTITTTEKGHFSARLLLQGTGLAASGTFTNGHTSRPIHRGSVTYTLSLQLDDTGNVITGQLTGAGRTAELEADRFTFNARTNVYSGAGTYNFLIPPPEDVTNAPSGSGFGIALVGANGSVSAAGWLADGTKFTQRTFVSPQGFWPFYAAPYSGRGIVLSWQQFASNHVGGELIWIKQPNVHNKAYPGGFTNDVMVSGSKFTAAAAGSPVVDWPNGRAQLILSGAGIGIHTNEVSIDAKNRITNLGGLPLNLNVIPSSGAFRGSVRDTGAGRTITIQGLLLQDSNAGAGYFLNQNQAGAVYLIPEE
jgi:hypothetical protein